jgi:hypothetical protein
MPQMKPAPLQFTAAQIAAALGKAKRTVLASLEGIAATGHVVVSGNAAQAWSLESLPVRMRAELSACAKAKHCRDAAHLLASPSQEWKAPLRLSEVAEAGLAKAGKLQRALARVLALQTDLSRTSAELEQIGLDDYRREFGFAITDRALRGLVKRTIERDGGAENFTRLELYLDERPARKAPLPSAPRAGDEVEFSELREVLVTFKKPTDPTDAELAYLWLRAFEILDAAITAGKTAKRTQRALVRFLFAVMPSLAKHEAALLKTFKRKLARWQENGRRVESLTDKRAENSGFHRAPELSTEDRDKLIAHARFNCDGRVSQAWRELCQRGELSESLLGYYQSNPASKSHCPARIREAVKYEIEMMDDIHHGPRQDKLNGAHLLRDWSAVAPMDWLCADDGTLEIYFYIPDGKGWFTLMRGQCLLMIDARTLRVLGFALHPETNYNARVIRSLITKICDEHGLPRKGFLFENGIWKSRILKGASDADDFSWGETELGLRSLGLRFWHSRLPRSKPVERVIGAIQDLCEGEPGYVGPDEMHERFERIQRAKLQVAARKVHPSEHFYSFEQWEQRLGEICEQYNDTKQDGKMTGRNSPDDAFEKFEKRDDPPTKLPAGCRYLLSHHKRPVRVTSNGITLRFGKQVYNYRNAQTGPLRGQQILAWFNSDMPEVITVTDMNRQNPFTIERTQEVPAMDAPPELLAQEMERINAHMSFARTRYRTLKAKFSVPFRRTIADHGTVSLGVEIAAQQTAVQARRVEKDQQQTRVRKIARANGIARPELLDDSEQTARSVSLADEARRERDRELRGEATETSGEL